MKKEKKEFVRVVKKNDRTNEEINDLQWKMYFWSTFGLSFMLLVYSVIIKEALLMIPILVVVIGVVFSQLIPDTKREVVWVEK